MTDEKKVVAMSKCRRRP